MLQAWHHIQLAMPNGAEDLAERFYSGILRMVRAPKPEALAERGGIWFEAGPIRLHLGVEPPFTPARKAHPAFEVKDLDSTIALLQAAGLDMTRDEGLPGIHRSISTIRLETGSNCWNWLRMNSRVPREFCQ